MCERTHVATGDSFTILYLQLDVGVLYWRCGCKHLRPEVVSGPGGGDGGGDLRSTETEAAQEGACTLTRPP